jgi:hypothetical protein
MRVSRQFPRHHAADLHVFGQHSRFVICHLDKRRAPISRLSILKLMTILTRHDADTQVEHGIFFRVESEGQACIQCLNIACVLSSGTLFVSECCATGLQECVQ